MAKWYGSVQNRIEERCSDAENIVVGMGVTEYFYSDCHAWEVIEVKDQKHITIRELDHKPADDVPMSNSWELVSNPNNRTCEVVKRGKYWYTVTVCTADMLEDFDNWDVDTRLWFCHNGFDKDTILAKGKQTRYHKKNIRVGHAHYYYDYSF